MNHVAAMPMQIDSVLSDRGANEDLRVAAGGSQVFEKCGRPMCHTFALSGHSSKKRLNEQLSPTGFITVMFCRQ